MMDYQKEALTYQQQLALLRKRGLQITDEKSVLNALSHVNYYRLSPYFIPFQVEKDIFNPHTTFEDIFDRKLLLLFLDAIEVIEVSIRALLPIN